MGQNTRRFWLYAILLAFNTPFVCSSPLEPTVVKDFTCGLETLQDATAIDVGCAQDLYNVDLFKGRIEKRRGSILENSTTLGSYAQAVRFLHEFPDANGNFWFISASSATIFKSNDGGVTNTVLTSTHGFLTTSQYTAVNAYGKMRLTDGTTNWVLFDGTNVTVSTASPKGTLSSFFAERVWTADVSGTRSTLYGSRFGDPEDWTDSGIDDGDATSIPIRNNDGYPIRALVKYGNSLIVFKDFSMDALSLTTDGLTFNLNAISNTIGTTQPKSCQVVNNVLYFLGSEGFYSFNGVSLDRISDDILPTVNSIAQQNASQRSYSETTLSDFTAGAKNRTSSSLSPADVVLSTFGFVDTSASDFNSGTLGSGIDTTTYSGDVVFSTLPVLYDNFADGDYTSSVLWVATNIITGASALYSTFTVVSNEIRMSTTGAGTGSSGYGLIYTVIPTSATGISFKVHIDSSSSGSFTSRLVTRICGNSVPTLAPSFQFEGSGSQSDCLTTWYTASEIETTYDSIGGGFIGTPPPYSVVDFSTHTIRHLWDATGVHKIYIDGVLGSSSTSTGITDIASTSTTSYFAYGAATLKMHIFLDDVSFIYKSSTFTTQGHGLGTTFATVGQVTATVSLNGASVSYSVYSDSNTSINIGNSSTYLSSSVVTADAFTLGAGSYVFVAANFQRTAGTQYPDIQDITLSLKPSTGSYLSSDIPIGTGITSWGAFSETHNLGSGAITYVLYTDTDTSISTSTASSYISSQTITSGSVPTVSTNTHARVATNLTATAYSNTPTVNDFTLLWNEGTAIFPTASISYQGDYLCAVAIDSTSVNDTILVYDRNQSWTKYKDLSAYSMSMYRQRPYFGSNQTGSIFRFQVDGTYLDNASPITAYWVSKEFDFGYPNFDKVIDRYYVTGQYSSGVNVTFEYATNRSLSTTTQNLDLGSVSGFFRQTIKPSSLTYSKGITHRVKVSNNSLNQNFNILSISLYPRLETAP